MRIKEDASPVTEADVRAEELIRATLARHFPGYGFYGEESGAHALEAQNLWLVDPIDGTKSFVREMPFFSTQIALLRAGELVLGVSSAPVYNEFAWAEAGRRRVPQRAPGARECGRGAEGCVRLHRQPQEPHAAAALAAPGGARAQR